jgi:steroid delta-isomerase-like uncharacterized protein
MINEETRRTRETIVRNHLRDEALQAWDDVLETFPHPRYELIATGKVYDGDDAVRAYYRETRQAFPDQNHEIISLRHSGDAVILEFWLTGTHLGPLGPIPPTGNRFRVRMIACFEFEGTELICERIYFDTLTMLRQLLSSVEEGTSEELILLARCLNGLAAMTGEKPDPGLLNAAASSSVE